jgi:NADPH2:quinone reductase
MALAPVESLIPLDLPDTDETDAAHAVAMVGTGRTALGILEEAALGPDDVVIVTAAAGGLGTLLVQAAKAAGAVVVGTAGGPEKVALVGWLGADVAVDHLDPAWPDQLREALGERVVTVALDGVGGAVGRAAFDAIAPGGRLVLFGYSSGTPTQLSTEDLFASGVTATASVGPRMFARPGGIQGLAVEAVERYVRGEWAPVVSTFPLVDAAGAHRALEERRTTGKVVLVP